MEIFYRKIIAAIIFHYAPLFLSLFFSSTLWILIASIYVLFLINIDLSLKKALEL